MATTEDFATDDNQCSELLDAIYRFTGKFVAYPSDAAHVAHVLWIAHTHMMDAWESTPRLAFLSPEPASGKTRALEISELLVPNAVEAINVTPAYLFRKVGNDDSKPTILYDEIDTVFGPKAKENEEIRGLLNAGHRRGAVAGRCAVRGKIVETEEIPAYCAVALAGLGWLPDTILTRSVIIRMRRRSPDEKITPFRRRVYGPEGHALQRRLAAWAAKIVDAMAASRPDMPPGIEDRDADVWEPLLAIAEAMGGDWPQRAREAAIALVGAAKDAEPSLGIRLLADMKTVFDQSTADALPTSLILTSLIGLPESPWGDLKGKPITDRALATRLRQYGIKSKDVRVGERALKGYASEDFHDAWRRYPPCDAAEARQARQARQTLENSGFSPENVADAPNGERDNAASEPDSAKNVADSERDSPPERDRNSPMKSSDVVDVADVADLTGSRGDDGLEITLDCRRCAHCDGIGVLGQVALPDQPGAVWLHRDCEAAWMAQTDPWALPEFLDRNPASRPAVDGLDDFGPPTLKEASSDR